MEEYILITFDSTHSSILAEKILKEKNISVRIVPLPTEISAGCGLSLMLAKDSLEYTLNTLNDKKIIFSGKYLVKKTGIKKNIEMI